MSESIVCDFYLPTFLPINQNSCSEKININGLGVFCVPLRRLGQTVLHGSSVICFFIRPLARKSYTRIRYYYSNTRAQQSPLISIYSQSITIVYRINQQTDILFISFYFFFFTASMWQRTDDARRGRIVSVCVRPAALLRWFYSERGQKHFYFVIIIIAQARSSCGRHRHVLWSVSDDVCVCPAADATYVRAYHRRMWYTAQSYIFFFFY